MEHRSRCLLVATTNQGKLQEIRRLLSDAGVCVVGLSDFPQITLPPETGDSFAANAVIKVEAAARASGLPAVADDSGLEVLTLGGEPGVRSARYAGEEADDRANNQLLLARLQGKTERSARFVCALAFGLPQEMPEVVMGECHGEILEAPRGSHGFGYDPLFYVPEVGKTLAELTLDEKNRISHRASALQGARPGLIAMLKRAGGG